MTVSPLNPLYTVSVDIRVVPSVLQCGKRERKGERGRAKSANAVAMFKKLHSSPDMQHKRLHYPSRDSRCKLAAS